MKKTTPADFGRATEARFLLDAHRHGLVVSRPFDSARGYDAVVDNGRRLYRVQVKGARLTTQGRADEVVYRINNKRYRNRRVKFDVMAVWLDNHTRWLFLPRQTGKLHDFKLTPYGKHSYRGWEVLLH